MPIKIFLYLPEIVYRKIISKKKKIIYIHHVVQHKQLCFLNKRACILVLLRKPRYIDADYEMSKIYTTKEPKSNLGYFVVS